MSELSSREQSPRKREVPPANGPKTTWFWGHLCLLAQKGLWLLRGVAER